MGIELESKYQQPSPCTLKKIASKPPCTLSGSPKLSAQRLQMGGGVGDSSRSPLVCPHNELGLWVLQASVASTLYGAGSYKSFGLSWASTESCYSHKTHTPLEDFPGGWRHGEDSSSLVSPFLPGPWGQPCALSYQLTSETGPRVASTWRV